MRKSSKAWKGVERFVWESALKVFATTFNYPPKMQMNRNCSIALEIYSAQVSTTRHIYVINPCSIICGPLHGWAIAQN